MQVILELQCFQTDKSQVLQTRKNGLVMFIQENFREISLLNLREYFLASILEALSKIQYFTVGISGSPVQAESQEHSLDD